MGSPRRGSTCLMNDLLLEVDSGPIIVMEPALRSAPCCPVVVCRAINSFGSGYQGGLVSAYQLSMFWCSYLCVRSRFNRGVGSQGDLEQLHNWSHNDPLSVAEGSTAISDDDHEVDAGRDSPYSKATIERRVPSSQS